MDYKEFLSSYFTSFKVLNSKDNEFIVNIPLMYRFSDCSSTLSITTNNDGSITISDRGETIKYLEDCFVKAKDYENQINAICMQEDIEFTNNCFVKHFPANSNKTSKNFMSFICALYMIANINITK